jgi:surfeit locus 1 family protein
MTSRHFRPSLLPTVAALLAALLTVSLGNWQRGRAMEKQLVHDQLMARRVLPPLSLKGNETVAEDLVFRRVVARGTFEARNQLYLDNKSHQGKVGVHVVTPMRLADSNRILLVNRGWMPRPREYPAMPVVAAPFGTVEIAGLAVTPVKRFLELTDNTAQGALWQNLTIARAQELLGETVMPVILQQDVVSSGLVPVNESPDAGIDKHRGYAFQWYALATLVVLLWLGLNFRKVKNP